MKELPLIALRALAAVYSHGGVRAAADELGIAHSSVSRHLAELQALMHVALREPDTGPRKFALTPQGAALGQAALSAMRILERALHTSLEEKPQRAVTVSTTPSFATRWLLPRLSDFEAQHRAIQLSVVVEQKVENLSAADIDLAIRMGRGPWKGLDCEPLMDDLLYPVMSPKYFEASKRPRALRQLKGLRLLHDRDPNAAWSAWRDEQGPQDLDVRSGPRYTSSELVLRAAALSQGVALARHRLIGNEIESGALLRPFHDRSIRLPDAYWIVMPSRSRNRRDVAKLVAWLKVQVAQQP
jgi:LysR family transcriptional regulator, glycine cleavage system transcriptional activator